MNVVLSEEEGFYKLHVAIGQMVMTGPTDPYKNVD